MSVKLMGHPFFFNTDNQRHLGEAFHVNNILV